MALDVDVDGVRAFNRFYTGWVGALGEEHLETGFSLTETRVLYEIAHLPEASARAVSEALRLDAGYVSRMVGRFRREGWVEATAAARDARVQILRLTEAGWQVLNPLQERARAAVAARIEPLGATGRARLLGAMGALQDLLDPDAQRPYLLRSHRPGDAGWVVAKHAEVYCEELGWDSAFEATVARIAADFVEHFDPATHAAWIAERDGEPIGSVFVVPHDARTAKLRMLVVDRRARGLGIGRRLVDEAIRFARSAGYASMTLWTFDALTAAGAIYRGAGFRCTRSEPTRAFGKEMAEQIWTLDL